jgi:hypothetical protein
MNLWAFWKYDLFPYCLGAPVESMNGEYAKLTNYGGMEVKFFKIVEGEAGAELNRKITELADSRTQAIRKLNQDFNKALAELIDIPK